MTVEELITKLKKCPKKAQVCWDSDGKQYWFGESVEVERMTNRDLADNVHDETGTFDDMPPFRSLVRLT